MADKMTATINYLHDARRSVTVAAERLDAQDGWHLEHARQMVRDAIGKLELCARQIDREQAARAARLTEQATDAR